MGGCHPREEGAAQLEGAGALMRVVCQGLSHQAAHPAAGRGRNGGGLGQHLATFREASGKSEGETVASPRPPS